MYRNFVKISLILVYLVIVAGAMVRMTGSGMGCPDWPKCFGYYIPPSEITELQFQPNRLYEEGQIIIVGETLVVAASDFTSGETYNQNNWETYTKHDYALFNPWHTWIEYINRLFGALAGFAVLIMAFLSIPFWRTKKRIPLLSWLTAFLMGFQAWLGATVVYSVLSPVKITIHMVMALVIVAVILYLLQVTQKENEYQAKTSTFQNLMILALILTLVQVILGTQVRQLVDEQIKALGSEAKALWLEYPTITFYVHRSFSILVLLVNLFLWWQNRKQNFGFRYLNWVMVLLLLEIITGIAMFNFDFPLLSQPLHLVLASILFGIQFYVLLQTFSAPHKVKSL